MYRNINVDSKEVSLMYQYLLSLEARDRENLLVLLDKLNEELSADTKIIAIGGSVRALEEKRLYKDLDIKVFGTYDTIRNLSKDIYKAINQIAEFEVEGSFFSAYDGKIGRCLSRFLPFSFPLGGFSIIPKNGRTIDLLISSQFDFNKYIRKMEDKNRPYVVLN